jgi:hypothetical protein
MKYWKQFWRSLNQGWKRVHYVALPIVVIIYFFSRNRMDEIRDMGDAAFIIVPLAIVLISGSFIAVYFTLITIVFWIKEGFQTKGKEQNKED